MTPDDHLVAYRDMMKAASVGPEVVAADADTAAYSHFLMFDVLQAARARRCHFVYASGAAAAEAAPRCQQAVRPLRTCHAAATQPAAPRCGAPRRAAPFAERPSSTK